MRARVLASEGIDILRTPPQAPTPTRTRRDGCARYGTSASTGSPPLLLTTLAEYVTHYNEHRPHQARYQGIRLAQTAMIILLVDRGRRMETLLLARCFPATIAADTRSRVPTKAPPTDQPLRRLPHWRGLWTEPRPPRR